MSEAHNNQSTAARDIASSRELDQLCRFAATLGTTLDVDTLIQDSLEPLLSMSGADRMMIALARTDARLLIPVASYKWQMNSSVKGLPAPPVASLGTESKAFDSISELPPQLSSKLGDSVGPIAAVPLWAHAHLRGVIVLQRMRDRFSSHSLKLLTASGRQLALAVENSQLLSDLQQSYRKLMDTQEGLIRAERLAALGQLSATMAHEIRNPLATIFSAISQIRKHSQADGVSATLLDIAEEEAVRLNSMVGGLLEFARPRKPVFEDDSILAIVRDVIENSAEFQDLEDRRISIVVKEDSDEVNLLCDRELIHRAVDLVVSNAIYALEENGGQIDIKVEKVLTGALIEIRDSGQGIPTELLTKIYEPFFSTKPSGTGLGLPTVKRIAEDHSGTVEIVSELGTGTVVRLFINVNRRNALDKEYFKQ